MVIGTIEKDAIETIGDEPKEIIYEGQRLDCVFDDEPLGFEKDPSLETTKIQAQNPLEEIDLGDGSIKWPTYISSKIGPGVQGSNSCTSKEVHILFCLGLQRNVSIEHKRGRIEVTDSTRDETSENLQEGLHLISCLRLKRKSKDSSKANSSELQGMLNC